MKGQLANRFGFQNSTLNLILKNISLATFWFHKFRFQKLTISEFCGGGGFKGSVDPFLGHIIWISELAKNPTNIVIQPQRSAPQACKKNKIGVSENFLKAWPKKIYFSALFLLCLQKTSRFDQPKMNAKKKQNQNGDPLGKFGNQ